MQAPEERSVVLSVNMVITESNIERNNARTIARVLLYYLEERETDSWDTDMSFTFQTYLVSTLQYFSVKAECLWDVGCGYVETIINIKCIHLLFTFFF